MAIPNTTDVEVDAVIRIDPTKAGLDGLPFDKHKDLTVAAYGLSTDPCEIESAETLPRQLELHLGAWDVVSVRVVIETLDPRAIGRRLRPSR